MRNSIFVIPFLNFNGMKYEHGFLKRVHLDYSLSNTAFCFKRYEGHLESKERFAIQRYLLIIGKKQNTQVF